jgi:hypothetical protein
MIKDRSIMWTTVRVKVEVTVENRVVELGKHSIVIVIFL